jgi:glutamate dehydrogenase/leucine dehydrogenase
VTEDAATRPSAPMSKVSPEVAPTGDMTPDEAVTHFFDRAADHIGLADEMREVLRTSYRELRVQVPVRMDDGTLRVFTGYRIQHNGARARTRAGSGSIPTPTSTRSERWQP